MLADIRKRREFHRDIKKIKADLLALSDKGNPDDSDDPDIKLHRQLSGKLHRMQEHLEIFESNIVIRKAQKRALEIPDFGEKRGWWRHNFEQGMPDEAIQEWLTKKGVRGLRRMISQDRRKNFEWWWTKILIPALQALIPIIAMILVFATKK